MFASPGEIVGCHPEYGTYPVETRVADPGSSQAGRVRGRCMWAEQGMTGNGRMDDWKDGRKNAFFHSSILPPHNLRISRYRLPQLFGMKFPPITSQSRNAHRCWICLLIRAQVVGRSTAGQKFPCGKLFELRNDLRLGFTFE